LPAHRRYLAALAATASADEGMRTVAYAVLHAASQVGSCHPPPPARRPPPAARCPPPAARRPSAIKTVSAGD